jgi:hypothetical protein
VSRASLALAGLVVVGCYSPTIGNAQLRCDRNGGVCPRGFVCEQGSCWRSGEYVAGDLYVSATDDMGGGSDLAPVCVESSIVCADATTPAVCQSGAYVKQTACSGALPYCVGGACVACMNGDSKYVDAITIAVCSSNIYQNTTCPANARAASIDTGKCYDPEWPAWPMPGSGAHTPSYTPSTNTVRDNVTHLVWQRGFAASKQTYAQAISYCNGLAALDGMAGWRLPSRIEVVSLLQILAATPYIDTAAFPSTPADVFWTSSLDPPNGANAWVIDFNSLDAASFGQTGTENVRCVR